MIAVVLAQLATRWGQALTLFVLSTAATVGAVCVPAYGVAIDRAAVRNEVAAAENSELTVSLPPLSADSPDPRTDVTETVEGLQASSDARSRLAGFTPVTTAQIHVQGLARANPSETRSLLARDGFCERVGFREGRCPVGSREAALPTALAHEARLRAGDEVQLTPVRRKQDSWEPDGPPTSITIVGVFDADQPASPYWSLEDPLGRLGTPSIMTNRMTVASLPHRQETVYLDAVMPPGLLTPERLPPLRGQLQAAEQRLTQDDPYGAGLLTVMPALLDRIENHGTQARALLPIAAAPLIALCWFVIHLAVGHGVWGRRQEIGTVALRGARWPTRAMSVSAESLVPLLVGVPAGLVVTRLLVALTVPGQSGLVGIDRPQLVAAAFAAGGTIVAALLALRRELSAPVAQLLRQVPPRSRRVVVAAVELMVVALGVVVVAETRSLGGSLVGVMVAAPVVVILAVAMLVSLAVRPLIGMAGRWSLRRGRIGPGVAAFYLARRPGSVRLLVVLAMVFGTFAFAATATDVAAQGRQATAEQLLGASRVLQVQELDRTQLLRAVRAADPAGRHAMAVVSAPGGGGEEPPVLAVDSTRLADVARWSERDGAVRPAQVAALLRPPAPKPILVGNGELTAELDPDPFTEDGTLTVSLLLRTAANDQVVATFGPVVNLRPTYRAPVTDCSERCRLVGLTITTTSSEAQRVGVNLLALRQNGRDVLTRRELADARRWRASGDGPVTEQLRVVGGEDGLSIAQSAPQPGNDYVLRTVDVPYPLPAITAGRSPGNQLTNIDGEPVSYVARAQLTSLPGVGAKGALIDLDYAERLTKEPGFATTPQVWLAAGTPHQVVDRLRQQGLTIVSDRTVASLRASMDRSGAAMALHAYRLASGITVLVGLGALALVVAVDRRTWNPGMRALRAQGAAERMTTGAALWSYGGIVVTSAVTGMLAAAVAWFATSRGLPLGVDEALVAAWPRWTHVVALEALAVGVLVAGAVAGGWWQRHLIRGRQEVGG
jgi:putative ABC transport system permease protein